MRKKEGEKGNGKCDDDKEQERTDSEIIRRMKYKSREETNGDNNDEEQEYKDHGFQQNVRVQSITFLNTHCSSQTDRNPEKGDR